MNLTGNRSVKSKSNFRTQLFLFNLAITMVAHHGHWIEISFPLKPVGGSNNTLAIISFSLAG